MKDYFEKYQKRRIISANISVVISISVVLLLLGILGFFMLNANTITNHLKEKIVITVFFKSNAKLTEIKKFEKKIKLQKEVKSTIFISKKQAAETFVKNLGEDFIDYLDYNPLQDNLEINLNGDFVNEKSLKDLKSKWIKNSIIADVNYEYYKPIVNILNNNVKKLSFWIIIVSGIFLVLVFLLINSAIRLSIYSKRFTIKTMQLVGATKAFIRKPFLIKSFLLGIAGAFLASIVLFVLLYYADNYFTDLQFLSNTKLTLVLFGGVFIIGILVTLTSTFLATRHFLNINSDKLHF